MRSIALIAALLVAGCSKKDDRAPAKAEPTPVKAEPAPVKAEPVPAGGERVYVTDEDGGKVVVISTANDTVVGNLAVGKRPRGLRVSPDGTRLYVALSGTPKAGPGVSDSKLPPPDPSADGIAVVDLASLKVLRVIPGGRDPETVDVTGDGKRLWVSNEDAAEASLVDVEAGQLVHHVPVGKEPEGITIAPDGKSVYVTNEADNSVSILDIESGRSLAQIATGGRPRSVAFTRDGQRAFVACETTHALTIIDAKSRTRVGDLELPGDLVRPMGMVLSPDGGTLYATGGRGKTVHVIALDASPSVKATIADVGARPWGIGITSKGDRLYTANGSTGDVSVIDTATGTVARRIAVGGSPWGVAIR